MPRLEVGQHELREAHTLALGGLALFVDAGILGRRRAGPRGHAELGHSHDHVAVVQGVRLAHEEAVARPACARDVVRTKFLPPAGGGWLGLGLG
jgi:hypothetical protein